MIDKNDRKEIINITARLIIFYVIGGFLLVSIYALTKPVIDRNDAQKKIIVLKGMIPGAEKVETLSQWDICDRKADIFKVSDNAGALLGYVVESYGKGYSGFIHTMVAVDPSQKITNITVLGHTETPGLGDVIEKPDFQKQFFGKSLNNMVLVKAGGTDNIQAVSGATFSSRGVLNAQADALDHLSKVLQK